MKCLPYEVGKTSDLLRLLKFLKVEVEGDKECIVEILYTLDSWRWHIGTYQTLTQVQKRKK